MRKALRFFFVSFTPIFTTQKCLFFCCFFSPLPSPHFSFFRVGYFFPPARLPWGISDHPSPPRGCCYPYHRPDQNHHSRWAIFSGPSSVVPQKSGGTRGVGYAWAHPRNFRLSSAQVPRGGRRMAAGQRRRTGPGMDTPGGSARLRASWRMFKLCRIIKGMLLSIML